MKMVISLKQKIMEADINNLKKDIRNYNEQTSSRNEFLFQKVDDKLIVYFVSLMVLSTLFVIVAVLTHNSNPNSHSNMQQHIYRDMYNNTIDFDHELEIRGWHKECVENATFEYKRRIEYRHEYTITYEPANITYCTKYQLVTTR